MRTKDLIKGTKNASFLIIHFQSVTKSDYEKLAFFLKILNSGTMDYGKIP